MDEIVTIKGDGLTARIKHLGAELCSLVGPTNEEVLWQAGAQWPRHAPILFPIVGRLSNDSLHHRGRSYRMTQHGFARDRRFSLEEQSATQVRFSLEDDAVTAQVYPFGFKLSVTFRIESGCLFVTYHLANPGEATLGASIGAHPAFRWPLKDGIARTAHTIRFARTEAAPLRRLAHGLLDPVARPSPIKGDVLTLDPSLFLDDALIFEQLESRWVKYSAPGCEPIVVAWSGFNTLGVWAKPEAEFLCIEPWSGTASPVGFDGAFLDKPGVFRVAPDESRLFSHVIALGETACRSITDGRG